MFCLALNMIPVHVSFSSQQSTRMEYLEQCKAIHTGNTEPLSCSFLIWIGSKIAMKTYFAISVPSNKANGVVSQP